MPDKNWKSSAEQATISLSSVNVHLRCAVRMLKEALEAPTPDRTTERLLDESSTELELLRGTILNIQESLIERMNNG